MDRNLIDEIQLEFNSVALRKESVDRNTRRTLAYVSYSVALRKESVDRNNVEKFLMYCSVMSLSARRAWIEIFIRRCSIWVLQSLSARRAWIEIMGRHEKLVCSWSLSARRAWIEIMYCSVILSLMGNVALRKESVDRNTASKKYLVILGRSLSARRAWIEIRLHR